MNSLLDIIIKKKELASGNKEKVSLYNIILANIGEWSESIKNKKVKRGEINTEEEFLIEDGDIIKIINYLIDNKKTTIKMNENAGYEIRAKKEKELLKLLEDLIQNE